MENIKELLRKVKALADQGIGGEKEAAQKKLNLLLKKYKVDISELLEEEKKTYWFKSIKYKKLLAQIVYRFTCDNSFYTDPNRKNQVGYKLTIQQYIDVKEHYEHYKKSYESEVKLFLKAFIHRNHIYPENGPVKEYEELSEEERKEAERMAGMAENITRTQILKKIEK